MSSKVITNYIDNLLDTNKDIKFKIEINIYDLTREEVMEVSGYFHSALDTVNSEHYKHYWFSEVKKGNVTITAYSIQPIQEYSFHNIKKSA